MHSGSAAQLLRAIALDYLISAIERCVYLGVHEEIFIESAENLYQF
ncbi:MAG: hypothetical protein KME15_15000 [Drouetiella hepatica Uher 2000/2452]|uniref:Uncharacterized protein n=1 Tax=Drouetiella hepatica Uher 2000/2452 TaxID=904376 RepID=A0A951QCL2_9CYAN|nr:hypothetical protein [Drouetiella hepatica Uher 2000/2452]